MAIATWLAALATPLAAQSANELQVTPETMTVGVGQKQPIFASAYDRQGNIISSAKFTFWSSDTAIARVSKDGSVLGVAPGLAKVEARLQGKRASLAVLVTGTANGGTSAGGGVALALDPTTAVLLPGESILISPHALREDGTQLPLARAMWKSLKPEVATVDSTGLVVAVAPGKSIVQANGGAGLMATVPVEVEQADVTLEGGSDVLGPEEAETLHVRVPTQGNREITTGLQWRSADSAIATVGPDGVIQARQPGRTEIILNAFGLERRAGLTVHRLPQVLVVTPKPPTEALQIPLKATREFTAVAQAADSTPIPEARITWEVGDTSKVSFDRPTGALVARDTGATTLTARLAGFEAVVWRLNLIAGVLGLDRSRVGLRLGEKVVLAANLLDEARKVIAPATGVEWSSDRPDVATVNGGEVRALSPGRAVVSALLPGGKPVTAAVFVTADLLVSSNRSGAFGLYQVRPESPDTLLPVLVDGGGGVQGMRSPDRTRIVFSSSRAGSFDLYVMDADGRAPRRITIDGGSEGDPVWTPDGSRILYTGATRAGVPQVMSILPDGGDPRPITTSTGGNRNPDVSPDGRRVAFISTRDDNPEIYEAGIDGGEARRLTKTGDRENSPRYLPNGDLIYVVEKGSKARVMRLSAGAAAPLPVMEIDQPVIALDVSRDGERVAYVAGKLAEAGKGKSQLTLRIQPLGATSTPLLVPLRPGEQVLSPSF
ncbi:MAG: Ig-like domain-containing protein [Gemmatimonadales bacterium]